MERAPFSQLRFDKLPEEPRRPHPFFEMQASDIVVEDSGFGPLKAHVRTYGEGPPLLLLHGLMTSSYSWRYVLEPLGERFTLYAPDLPGAGRTEKVLEPEYTPRALAGWISSLQRRLDIEGCDVIGNSLGGYLAMWLAIEKPDAVGRLVNLHSPGVPLWRLRALNVALSIPGTRRFTGWLAGRAPERWAHKNVHYFDETLKSREEAREYGRPLSTREGRTAFVKYLAETIAPSHMVEFRDELRELRGTGGFPVPLSLIYAREDPVVPPVVGERLARLVPDAEMVWLEDASHFAHVDATDRFLAAALPFLGSE